MIVIQHIHPTDIPNIYIYAIQHIPSIYVGYRQCDPTHMYVRNIYRVYMLGHVYICWVCVLGTMSYVLGEMLYMLGYMTCYPTYIKTCYPTYIPNTYKKCDPTYITQHICMCVTYIGYICWVTYIYVGYVCWVACHMCWVKCYICWVT